MNKIKILKIKNKNKGGELINLVEEI
jgi:hypothetical protein